MRVKISITVEVDSAEWDLEYGTGTKAADVREDVIDYVRGMIEDAPAPVRISRRPLLNCRL